MFAQLMKSIVTTDWYMLIAVAFALGFLVICLWRAGQIKEYVAQWQTRRNVTFSRFLHRDLSVFYNLLVAMISIFPLLGMLGTVRGLLGLKMAVGDMAGVQASFFGALTSTAWGIIFSVLFKLIHALVQDTIESQIEASQQLSEEIGELPKAGAER